MLRFKDFIIPGGGVYERFRCIIFSKLQFVVLSFLLVLFTAHVTWAETSKKLVGFGHNPYDQGNISAVIGILDNTYTDENGNRIGTGPSIMDVVSRELYEDELISQPTTAAFSRRNDSGRQTPYHK